MSVGAYAIRRARASDLAGLAAIDASADTLLHEAGPGLPSDAPPLEANAAAQARGLLWVATAPGGTEVIGYVAADRPEEGFLVGRLAVARAHQRRGVGATLLAAAVDHARWAFEPAVLLVADRDLPWSGPFFARYGFVALAPSRLPAGLATALDSARHPDPNQRVTMAKRL